MTVSLFPAGHAAEDARLVREARQGDERAFAHLYERYARVIHGVLLARAPRADVEDLVQDVFTAAWNRLDALRDPAAFGGWLAMIARNRAADFHRQSVESVELPDNLQAHDGTAARAEALAVLDVIKGLPEAYRETLVLLLVASGVLLIFLMDLRGAGWAVQSVTGMPVIDGFAIADSARLGIGEWLVTDGSSRARIDVGRIGRVDVDPNSRVQLVVSAGREHRMALERGTIHARIWAPPKFFYVNTPAAVAIDLGCAYSLHVDGNGAGLLRVTHGWVGFESAGRQSFVPEGAMCATRPGVGPGTPRYEDAPSGYAAALATLDFGAPDDPGRTAAFELVVSQARRRDALTLWHLLARGTPAERERVFDRLSALAPPPSTVTRRLVLAGDRRALDQWWDALGVESSTWWRLWKKKW